MAGEKLSLLDTAGRQHVQWYVLYQDEENEEWWNRFLKRGFRHVQIWKPVQFGPTLADRFWLVVDPGMEHVEAYIDHDPMAPWDRITGLTVQAVETMVPMKRVREYFFIGPITCVEIAKAHLGIRSPFIRTPWQLYKHIRKNNHRFVLR